MEYNGKVDKLKRDIKCREKEKGELLNELFNNKCYNVEVYKSLLVERDNAIKDLKRELRTEKRNVLQK